MANRQTSTPVIANTVTTLQQDAVGAGNGFGVNVLGGSTITVSIALWTGGGAATVTSVTDTLSNSYTQVATIDVTTNRVAIWRAFNVTGGACRVTVNISAGSDLTFVTTELSDRTTTDSVDAFNTASATGVTAPVSATVQLTTVEADTDVIGVFAHDASDRALTEGSGYTMIAEDEGGSAHMPIAVEFQTFASAGAKTVDGTVGGTGTVNWMIAAASFKAGAGGGGEPDVIDKPGANLVRPFNFSRAGRM